MSHIRTAVFTKYVVFKNAVQRIPLVHYLLSGYPAKWLRNNSLCYIFYCIGWDDCDTITQHGKKNAF